MQIPEVTDAVRLDCDVLVVGGGTAGTMAALTAAENGARVVLLEKAHVRHSGALAMGMDGVNNAVIPGKAEPEDYVAEITRANDGIVNQRTIYQTATRGFAMVQRLERYGVKFEKDEHGEYAVRRVHRSGSYVLPMPEGKDVKKALYRVLRQRSMREKIRIENRLMPVRVLTDNGRAVGVAALNSRSGEFVVVGAKAVILATGPCGRLGLPASGYLYGTYENPTNAGDGYSMAYHAGAELSGIECFQINPLIKDYNGPACAYVANPFGGYQVNALGERFVDSDYWSGQMMAEVKSEIESARGPIYLKVSHLPDETLTALENILHTTERPTRGTFHANRGHDYRTHDIEMHISEIGLCSGHSASGVWVDENARTTVPGLYAAGDLACVPHNYMIGAFVYGDLAGADAASTLADVVAPQLLPDDQVREAHELVYRPLRQPRRSPAAAGRVQTAPVRQRLCGTPEDGRQAVACRADLRADARRGGRYRRPHPARTDARCRGFLHPGLRRDGGTVIAHPGRITVGSLPRSLRYAGPRRRELALPPESAQGRRRVDGVLQAPGGALLRPGTRSRRPAQRRVRTHCGHPTRPRRGQGAGVGALPRYRRRSIATAVAAHRRGPGIGITDDRRAPSLPDRRRRGSAAHRRARADRDARRRLLPRPARRPR